MRDPVIGEIGTGCDQRQVRVLSWGGRRHSMEGGRKWL
jgi:hypothetical protein